MPTWPKVLLLILLVAVLIFIATPLDDDEPPPAPAAISAAGPAPVLSVSMRDGNLIVDGSSRTALRDDLITLMKTLRSGSAQVMGTSIQIEGVASTKGAFADALARFRARLPGDTEFSIDVFVVDDTLAVDALCERMFAAIREAPVRFFEATTNLRSAAIPALDRLVDFAIDCRGASIMITGHSDSTGDAAFNLQLSRRRAQAVADYLSERGVAATRLKVLGAGASQPIADNATGLGRGKNRRIEFRLGPPDEPESLP